VRKARARYAWPIAAVATAVAVSLTDWPLGWSFWVDHPLDAALVAGAVLVFVTATVLDAYLRSREARRWRSVGRAAAAEFSHVFDQATIAMLGLLGFEARREPGTRSSRHSRHQGNGRRRSSTLRLSRARPRCSRVNVIPTTMRTTPGNASAWPS
jgi:hypothetical protein